MPPKSKADYRRELINNIKIIQTIDPGFTLTEEQIEAKLSDEKIRMHQKYYGQNPETNKREGKMVVEKYTPSIPDAFARHADFLARPELTEEDKEYNKKLFDGIGRDDEQGIEVQNNYIIQSYNAINKVDMSKMDPDAPFEEFMEYCAKNSSYGKAIMESEHVLASSKTVKAKESSKEKIRAFYNFGSAAGAVIGSAVKLVGNEGFLTIPWEYIKGDLITKVGNYFVAHPELTAKYGPSFVGEVAAWNDQKNNAKKEYQKFRSVVKEGEEVTLDDFEENLPKSEIIGGGYEKRRELALNTLAENASFDIFAENEDYKNIIANGNELKEMINGIGDRIPTEEEQKALVNSATDYTKSIYDFCKTNDISKSKDPKVTEAAEKMRSSMSKFAGYSRKHILETNIHYFEKDIKQAELATNKAGYIKEIEHLVTQLKKTEGNWTSNSPAYDKFSKLLKDMPNKLKQLTGTKDINFEKIQEAFKPVVDAAGEYMDTHKNKSLNSRQFRRLKIMNRLKDLSKEASERKNTPGEDINYRLAEKLYTANAIKKGDKNALLNDEVRSRGIHNVLTSKRFIRDFINIPEEGKLKLLKISGEKVLDSMMQAYNKDVKLSNQKDAEQKGSETKKNVDPMVLG